MTIWNLSIKEVEHIAFKLAKAKLSYSEPIPSFLTRFPGVLESCLLVPFQEFDKKNLYKGLVEKAAILFYLMIKNHPFQNGNKRIAMTTLFVFLSKNRKWLRISNQELYNFAVWVAQSRSDLKDEVVSSIKKFIKTYSVNR